jgi:hypothetical protein
MGMRRKQGHASIVEMPLTLSMSALMRIEPKMVEGSPRRPSSFPKAKNFMKKAPQRALVANHEEYESGGEESEQVGMAAVAIGVLPSSLRPLFTSPNDNKSSTNHKCHMAKTSTSKVTPPLK